MRRIKRSDREAHGLGKKSDTEALISRDSLICLSVWESQTTTCSLKH